MRTFHRILFVLLLPVWGNAASNEFSILQFNIWNEARTIEGGFAKVVEVILTSDADIVAFSEVRNKQGDWHERIVNALKTRGETYYGTFAGGDVGVISRYPIKKTSVVYDRTSDDRGSIVAYHLELPGDRPLIVCTAHLDWLYYGLNLVRGYNGGKPDFRLIDKNKDGNPDHSSDIDEILEYNRQSMKDEAVEAFLAFATKHEKEGTPIILAGDFNDGSHLDWTKETRQLQGHNNLIIEWPNSRALKKSGFTDAYRKLYPDPVTHPGITWPSPAFGKGSTSWTPLSDERDRIDYIFYKGSLQPLTGSIVGPRDSFIKGETVPNTGKDHFLCHDLNWPSDHKGVLITFKLPPPNRKPSS